MLGIKAKIWEAFQKQGRETACRKLREHEDSVHLFFLVVCNKKILFCLTLDVKALILEW